MNNELLEELKTELEVLKHQYQEVLNRPMSGTKKSTDMIDVARNEVQIHTSAFFRNQMDIKLQQINQALEAMDNGTYGICKVTGESISERRLKAVPWSLTTMDAVA